MTEQRRWRLLEDWSALTRAGWLPDAESCPTLADLREAHERVLAAAAEASATAGDLAKRREDELEAIRAAEEDALFRGKEADPPPLTVTEDEIAEARARAEAGRDAVQRFVLYAVEQTREREPEIMAALDSARKEAADKRAEAQKLLAEADRLEAAPKRLMFWLDRITGRSNLGHFPFAEMVAPPPPESLDLETVLVGGSSQEVEVYG